MLKTLEIRFSSEYYVLSTLVVLFMGAWTNPSLAESSLHSSSNSFDFCNKLTNVFHKFGKSQGMQEGQSLVLAADASRSMIKRLRNGDQTEYVSLESLKVSKTDSDRNQNKYFQLSTILGDALGLKKKVLVGFNIHELKYLPNVQHNSHIILLLNNSVGLSVRRAKMVKMIAEKSKIGISVLWIGPKKFNSTMSRSQRGLEYITAATNGSVIDLGGRSNVCETFL